MVVTIFFISYDAFRTVLPQHATKLGCPAVIIALNKSVCFFMRKRSRSV